MVLDPATRKWVGNESDFANFYDAVSKYQTAPEHDYRDDSLFDVPISLLEQWKEDGMLHNRLFPRKSTPLPTDDIRNFVPAFLKT